MDGKGLAILILLFLIAMMVFYPQRSGYAPTGSDPVGSDVVTTSVSGSGPMVMQGGSGGTITQGGLADAPGGMYASVSDPAPFEIGGSGVRTVDMPVYDNTNVGLIPSEVVTTEDFGQFSQTPSCLARTTWTHAARLVTQRPSVATCATPTATSAPSHSTPATRSASLTSAPSHQTRCAPSLRLRTAMRSKRNNLTLSILFLGSLNLLFEVSNSFYELSSLQDIFFEFM